MSGFIPGVQGVSANNTIPGHHRYIIVRGHTQHALHKVCHTTLQRPPSPPFRCDHILRTKTACRSALSSRVRFARRARHSGHSVSSPPFRYGRGPRPRLWTTSLHYTPACTLQPTEPVPPTSCRPASASGGPAAFAESLALPLRHLPNEIRRRYGGATFEYKTCRVFIPGGTWYQHTCHNSPPDHL